MLEENNFEITGQDSETDIEKDVLEEALQPLTEEEEQEPLENPYYKILERHRNKKEIRRIALAMGLSTLCISAISILWSFIYLFFSVVVARLSLAQATNFLQNPAIKQVLQIVLSCSMFLIPFSIAAKCLGVRIDHVIKFEKAKKGTFLPFLLIGIGFCAFSNLAMNYASSIFDLFGIRYEVNSGESPKGIFGFLLSFIATAIVPALVEEFACRGILLGLLKKYGKGFAIITSAIVFGVMHSNFQQIPFATLVGLILGYIYIKTESIWVCVVVHFVNNAISVIFNYLPSSIGSNVQNLLYIVYLVAVMLAAIVGVLLLSKNDEISYELENEADEVITNKQKYIWFFTSWAIIVFIAINTIQAFAYFTL